ncbi:hypothetical protein [Corynebacterium pacaense]|uniref:hypothetical protein n=1 Tax=Corynebacterium pacaense TaxID=1816684 RepID=UPI0009BA3FB4|nr:hypothetical protein [Corynebacterium pacaense]
MSTFARCPHTFRPLEEGATTSTTGVPLPEGWSESVTHCVAMAGARASGKSLYTAVMVKQLELLGQEFNKVVIAADDQTRENYQEHYENPLYVEMKHMAPTPASASGNAYQRDPLIFALGRWLDPEGVRRQHYLVFRDVAGEDLENSQTDPDSMEFFRFADLIIFLFDPLKVNQISTYLRGLIPAPQGLGGEPETVLRNLGRILGDARPALAVTISKFDTLQKLGELPEGSWRSIMGNTGAAFKRDTGWDFDENDQQLLDLEIQSLLRYVQANNLLNQITEMYGGRGPLRYFAVSALGESPRGEHLSRQGIAPFRTLDPIRWALSPWQLFTREAQ